LAQGERKGKEKRKSFAILLSRLKGRLGELERKKKKKNMFLPFIPPKEKRGEKSRLSSEIGEKGEEDLLASPLYKAKRGKKKRGYSEIQEGEEKENIPSSPVSAGEGEKRGGKRKGTPLSPGLGGGEKGTSRFHSLFAQKEKGKEKGRKNREDQNLNNCVGKKERKRTAPPP